jgi:hemolysin activation/secretion protein
LLCLGACFAIAAPGAVKAETAAPARPAARPPVRFDVTEYRVEGNTVLSETDVDAAVYDFLGPGRTIDDIDHARAALEAAYAAHGYPTVSAEIPVQHVTDGVVVLHVTERTVGRLRVTGSRYYDLGDIKAGAPSLAEGRVPRMPDVQRDIVALNQLADRTVTPSLRAGAAPDTVDVDLQVEDRFPGHATLELNNRQSQATTPLRLQGSLSYDNLWQRGDSATVTFQVAPQDTANAAVVSGSYLFHIPASDLSLLASYLHSDSNVTTVGSTNVIGKGDIAGLRLVIPGPYTAGFAQTLSVGMDYKHFDNDTSLPGSTSAAPITYYPATISYEGDWNGPQAQTTLQSSLVFTFGGLGSSLQAFDYLRYDARPGFAYLRGTLTRTQTLPYDIQLYGHVFTQLAVEPLISNEQFSLGGLDTVRGYLESEALGDYGIGAQAELRSPSLAPYLGGRVQEARALVFVDAGSTAIHNPLPEQRASYTLASTGLGLRVRLLDDLTGELVGAFTLSDGAVTKGGDSRLLFRVAGDF